MIPQDEYSPNQETTPSDIFDPSPRETDQHSKSERASKGNSPEATRVEPTPRKPCIAGDRSLWFLYSAFLATSLPLIYSTTSTLAYRGESLYASFMGHLKRVVISTLVAWFCSRLSDFWLRLGGMDFFIIVLLTVIATPFIDTETNEAKHTLFELQFSEFYRIGIIRLASAVLSAHQLDNLNRRFHTSCGISAIGLVFVARESLSTGLVLIIFIVCAELAQTGLSKNLLTINDMGVGIFTLLLACPVLLPDSVIKKNSDTAHWKGRIEDFTSRSDSGKFVIDEDNFQEQHTRITISRSNGTGVFPGSSVEQDILPRAYSGFTYAIIIGEIGLIGMIWVPLLYILLFFKLSCWATRTQRDWQHTLLLGVGIICTTQTIVHICIVTGILPNTSQTLPPINRGGSSLLATSMATGACIGITRHICEEECQRQLEQGSQAKAATEPVAETASTVEGSPRPTTSDETSDIAQSLHLTIPDVPSVASLYEEHLQLIDRRHSLLTTNLKETCLLGTVDQTHAEMLWRDRLIGDLRALHSKRPHADGGRTNDDPFVRYQLRRQVIIEEDIRSLRISINQRTVTTETLECLYYHLHNTTRPGDKRILLL